jgi:hypothetical protein
MTNDPARDNLHQRIRDLTALNKALVDEKGHLESIMSAEASLRMELRSELQHARSEITLREVDLVELRNVVTRAIGAPSFPGNQHSDMMLNRLRGNADEALYFHEQLAARFGIAVRSRTAAELLRMIEVSSVSNSVVGDVHGTVSQHGDISDRVRF